MYPINNSPQTKDFFTQKTTSLKESRKQIQYPLLEDPNLEQGRRLTLQRAPLVGLARDISPTDGL
jgi:hypothetical protein